jgi:hypothetical protein
METNSKNIQIPDAIDDSIKLQKLINDTGNTPVEFVFSESSHVDLISLLRFYNFASIKGNGTTFELMENAPANIFGQQIPCVGSKFLKGTEGLCFDGIIFEGNRDHQAKVPTNLSHTGHSENWGVGYHNFLGIGNISNPLPGNALNCSFSNLEFNNNLGDGVRCEGGTNITVENIKAKNGGHDIICLANTESGEVANVKADLAINAGIRTRSSSHIKIHDCELNGNTGTAYSPGIQIQSTAVNHVSSDIEIYNNYIHGTYGPGIQIASNVVGNGLVSVHNNIINECGLMPASNKLSGVGGIVFDGFPVEICNNTLDKNRGYGLLAGNYDVKSSYKFTASIERNIITNTRASNYPGVWSGAALADLTGRYTITADENCLYGNLRMYYKITCTKNYYSDPMFISPSDFHLKTYSPCVFPNYNLGRYGGTIEATEYVPPSLPSVIIPFNSETELKVFVQELITEGHFDNINKFKFINVSDDFEV